MKSEIWKDVHGYEGYYQVSNLGRVRSVPRPVGDGTKRWWHGRIIKGTDNGHGYLIVGLRKNGERKNAYVHRLVAEHFLVGWNGGLVVDHIDYNKRNNRADNLRVVTQKENIIHSLPNMKKPRKVTRGKNEEKYIYKTKSGFRVCVTGTKERRCKTFEEAVALRRRLLSEGES